MVLSRFWLVIFISSIIFVVVSLFTANYSIDYVLNGQGRSILVSENILNEIPVLSKTASS
jgi:hypothetical protein